MTRYIDAEVLKSRLEDFSRWCKDGRKEGVDFVLDCPLPDIPTADVQEVRHGRWVLPQKKGCLTYDESAYKECSECGEITFLAKTKYGQMNYCPNCGAKMDREK